MRWSSYSTLTPVCSFEIITSAGMLKIGYQKHCYGTNRTGHLNPLFKLKKKIWFSVAWYRKHHSEVLKGVFKQVFLGEGKKD